MILDFENSASEKFSPLSAIPKIVPKHPPGGIIVQNDILDFLQLCSDLFSNTDRQAGATKRIISRLR